MNKIIIGIGIVVTASLIISIVGLVGVNQLSQLTNEQLGGTGTRFPHGISTNSTSPSSGEVRTDMLTLGDETLFWKEDSIAAGSNQKCVQLSTTATSTIDLGEMGYTFGVASSSYNMALFVASTSAIQHGFDYTGTIAAWNLTGYLGNQGILPVTAYATSTVGTTTTSIASGNTPANGEVIVKPAGYVCLYMNTVNGALVTPADGHTEPATSTARGFNPFFKLRYHR